MKLKKLEDKLRKMELRLRAMEYVHGTADLQFKIQLEIAKLKACIKKLKK